MLPYHYWHLLCRYFYAITSDVDADNAGKLLKVKHYLTKFVNVTEFAINEQFNLSPTAE